MAKILERRRVFFEETYQETEYRWERHPLYNPQDHHYLAVRGIQYQYPEYYQKAMPVTKTRRRSHIEYRIRCEHCGGEEGWVRRKDARFCSDACRKLTGREND